MKHKVLSVALPILLISGVGCSKEDTEKKKTDNLQVAEAESDKKALETANKEVDRLRTEKDELEKKIVKEPGIKEQEKKRKRPSNRCPWPYNDKTVSRKDGDTC